MSDQVNNDRRRFLRNSAMTIAAAEFAMMSSAYALPGAQPSKKNSAAGAPPSRPGTNTSYGPLKQIDAGVLSIAYAEAGPADGPPVLLFHGWPYDIHSFVDVAPILAAAGYRVLVPYLRGYGETRFLSAATPRNAQPAAVAADAISFMDALKSIKRSWEDLTGVAETRTFWLFSGPSASRPWCRQAAIQMPLPPNAENKWWYLFYFATDGGQAGYTKFTKDFNRFIWQQASPKWTFDDETFERSATAFENPDFVRISLSNYRWYLGLESGERKYDEQEKKIATFPAIACPTITLEGDANGAAHADPSAYAKKYVGRYEHRNITGGIGHNLPQEAPEAFAKAIVDVNAFDRP